ncbi:MAG: hypothetical protein RL330_679 [Actinomycetota bacterium]|jgi:hypothetical protein
MNDDDLDPRIVAALRDVPVAGAELREAHISSALSVLDRRGRRASLRLASVAAAGLVLLGAGFLIGRAANDDGLVTVSGSMAVDTAEMVKGSADATGDACIRAGRTVLGEFTDRGLVRIIVLEAAPARIVVVDPRDCSTVAEVELP